jgi:hypothetical protein
MTRYSLLPGAALKRLQQLPTACAVDARTLLGFGLEGSVG